MIRGELFKGRHKLMTDGMRVTDLDLSHDYKRK